MLFNSWVFVLFALVVYALYYFLPHRAQNRMLLVASYVFYGAWDERFLLLLLLSTAVDYGLGLLLERTEDPAARKRLVTISVIVNLAILGFFKYFNFFIGSMETLLTRLGMPGTEFRLHIVLPVGISFYTFQSMAYTIDVYRKKIRAERSFLDFALFVAFFPQLVAGPIERAGNLIPQLTRPRVINRKCIVEGLWLVLLGFFKKIVVADNLATVVDAAFAQPETPGGLVCLFAMYAFTIQGYCDFAGYSDIARGTAKLMGVDLMVNFNMPLIARNPSDFWRRWHISLSFWFRDYLYIPLGGNKLGNFRTYFNLTAVFVLSGLWHGATWTYVIWGFYNGFLTSVHRFLFVERTLIRIEGRWADFLTRIFYFHLTCIGLLAIRAQDMATVFRFLWSIVANMFVDIEAGRIIFFVVFLSGFLGAIEAWMRNRDNPEEARGWHWGVGAIVVTLMLLSLVLLPPPQGQPFIYFQF